MQAISACKSWGSCWVSLLGFVHAEQLPAGVVSATACVMQLQEAMAAGYAFFLSTNGVLLCEGPLPVQFVTKISQEDLELRFSGTTGLN